jgi:hypothetical protein
MLNVEEEIERNTKSVWSSIKRGLWRNIIVGLLAVVFYKFAENFPMLLGPVWAPMMRNMAVSLGFFNLTDVMLRIWMPYADNRVLVEKAEKDPIASAIVVAARMILVGIFFAVASITAHTETLPPQIFDPQAAGSNPDIVQAFYRDNWQGKENAAQLSTLFSDDYAHEVQYREPSIKVTPQLNRRIFNFYMQAQVASQYRDLVASNIVLVQLISEAKPSSITQMPPGAVKYGPLLIKNLKQYWPQMTLASLNAAQIEQETCLKLTNPQCWTSKPHLHVVSNNGTEDGVAFGQLTRVERPNGQVRFDNLEVMRLRYPAILGNYTWSNWDDPELAMTAYVLFMRDTCKSVPSSVTDAATRFKMCLSGYNGGVQGLLNDILSCRATEGCNPTKWDSNVEVTSAKSKLKIKGYGQSAFDTNRGYVSGITVIRRVRYIPFDKLMT